MIRGAIFDCDGTLFDSMYLYRNFCCRYLAGRGFEPEAELDETVRYMGIMEAAEYIRSTYGIGDTAVQIVQDWNRILERAYFHEIRLRPGVRELLAELHSRNIPMCIATATDRHLVTAALKREKIFDYFRDIITCGEVGAGKERPDVFLRALEILGTDAAFTWVFEDARHAVFTAKKCGFFVCAVFDEDERDHIFEIKEKSDIYLQSFAGFPLDKLFI